MAKTVSGVMSLVDGGNSVSAAARKVMWRLAETHFNARRKKGKIHARSLVHSVGRCKQHDVPDPRIFRNRVQGRSYDLYCTVMVDASGSMSYEGKMESAIASALILEKALTPLGVHVRIMMFSECGNQLLHCVLKNFKQKVTTQKMAEHAIKALGKLMIQNADGESILWEYGVLKTAARGTTKKFLFVLSDGSPASDTNSYQQADITKDAVRSIEKDPNTHIAGLGIMDDNVKRFYRNRVIVNNPEELPTKLIELVTNSLIKED